MKIAVIGKGGSGKTTTSAIVARTLAARGAPVLALDCDANANMALSLGLGVEVAEDLLSVRERIDAGEDEHVEDLPELLARFGREGPSGMDFVVAQRIDAPGSGCPCCGMSPQQLLNELDATERVVIADLEAGIGTMTRIDPGAIDVLVIVAEPTAKSLDVAERASELAAAKAVGSVLRVANRVRDDEDLELVRQRLGVVDVVVPDDPVVTRADREGRSPEDVDPDAPAVVALRQLADLLPTPQPA